MNDDVPAPAAPEDVFPHPVTTNDSTDFLFGVGDVGSESSQFFKFTVSGMFVQMGPSQASLDIEGIGVSPINNKLYALSAAGPLAGTLFTVDKVTGVLTPVGNTGIADFEAASFHPTTGELWAYRYQVGIYSINVDTAVATFQYLPTGDHILKSWEGLAWDGTGTFLYGLNRAILYKSDPVTHNTVALCSTLPEGEALEFSPAGDLWVGLDAPDPANLRLYTVNFSTCAVTSSGLDMPFSDIESIAFELPTQKCKGHIGDFVWNDLNGDGLQDAGEPGIAGVTVTLKQGATVLQTTATDGMGFYGFNGLCAGDYIVEVDATTLPPAFVPSPCNVGLDDTIDNDCSPKMVNLPTDSSSDNTNDFGYNCGCNDGNPCTIDTCDPQAPSGCMHTPFTCDDKNECTTDACDPVTGCSHTTIDCNDFDKCTNDRCDPATGCVHTTVDCHDDNACNMDSCDHASGCVHTVIDCNDHNKCTNDSCDPVTGCVNATISCDDGNACTADACLTASGCTHTAINCADTTVCTNDSCNPATGCVHDTISCDDSNMCTADSCDPASGCKHTGVDCNDGSLCTNDSCSPSKGCLHTTRSCDDGNPCSVDACNPASGCTNTPKNCNDSNACTADSCNPSTGTCSNTPIVCDDHSACTTDTCVPGQGCVFTPKNCDDANQCTTDSCNPTTGVCGHSQISCGDGNNCTTDTCNPSTGMCAHSTKTCDDANPCTADSCDPATGNCSNVPIFPAPPGCAPVTAPCRITGGGVTPLGVTDPTIMAEVQVATFGGQVGSPIGRIGCFDNFDQIQGSWTHHRKSRAGSFHAMDYNSLVCGCDGVMDGNLCNPQGPGGPQPPRAPANMACWSGVGDYNATNGNRTTRVAFRVEVEDRGEPGTNDVYKIRIWIPGAGETADGLANQACCTNVNPLAIRGANVNDGGTLIHGNIQIHPGH